MAAAAVAVSASSAAETAAAAAAAAAAAIAVLLVAHVASLAAVSMMVSESIAQVSNKLRRHAPLLRLPHASALSELLEQLRLHASVPLVPHKLQQRHVWSRTAPQVVREAPHVQTTTTQLAQRQRQVWRHE